MTILQWFFLIIWAILLAGMVFAPLFNPELKGFGAMISHIIGIFLVGIIYWGILFFLDIKFNFLHWF